MILFGETSTQKNILISLNAQETCCYRLILDDSNKASNIEN